MQLQDFKKKVFPLEGRIYRFARWILNDDHDARDMVQEVFANLWTSKAELENIRSLESFALRMTKNLCLNKLNRAKTGEKVLDQIPSQPVLTPFDRTTTREMIDIMDKIISQLPPQQKMIVQLKSVEQKSISEIAEILELTGNNTRVILSRARKKIKSELKKIYNDGN